MRSLLSDDRLEVVAGPPAVSATVPGLIPHVREEGTPLSVLVVYDILTAPTTSWDLLWGMQSINVLERSMNVPESTDGWLRLSKSVQFVMSVTGAAMLGRHVLGYAAAGSGDGTLTVTLDGALYGYGDFSEEPIGATEWVELGATTPDTRPIFFAVWDRRLSDGALLSASRWLTRRYGILPPPV